MMMKKRKLATIAKKLRKKNMTKSMRARLNSKIKRNSKINLRQNLEFKIVEDSQIKTRMKFNSNLVNSRISFKKNS